MNVSSMPVAQMNVSGSRRRGSWEWRSRVNFLLPTGAAGQVSDLTPHALPWSGQRPDLLSAIVGSISSSSPFDDHRRPNRVAPAVVPVDGESIGFRRVARDGAAEAKFVFRFRRLRDTLQQ